jgi:DNA primase
MAMSFSQAKQIPITEYLSAMGYEPSKTRGNDYWYLSPFRHERNPSLKVNAKLNVWYDHGSGEGGTIIDLGAKLHGCSLQEFLEKLSNGNYGSCKFPLHRNHFETPERKLEIVNVKDLSNPDLVRYIEDRKIKAHFANQFCKEVEFRIDSKTYLAIGFPNRSGGYELRNRWFKGSSSPKDISLVNNESSSLCVMEGFMDFLSTLTLHQKKIVDLPLKSSFLILNSLSFLRKNWSLLQGYKEVVLFLDNDLAGREAKEALTAKGTLYRDASTLYAPYKDVNEFLIKRKGGDPTLARSKGFKL